MSHVISIGPFMKLMEMRGLRVFERDDRIVVVDEAGMVIASSVKWQLDDHIFVARHPFKELLERENKCKSIEST